MAKKRLVVCCDGTWNDADAGAGYTNVSRLAWAIQPIDPRDGTVQVVFYQSGVGTEGDIVDKIKGAGIGLGLSHNVRDAYTFICNNYFEGDEIFLFGFSRGAYTARSVAGLIGYGGLVGKRDLDRFFELWDSYRTKNGGALANFKDRFSNVIIKCIGVWDTVGSVGIPGNVDKVFRDYYAFHNTELGAGVDFAFHALALDERRKDFVPTLWTQKPEGKARGQVLKQVWFAGVHSDVGGGYPVHGSSDVALAWMASEVEPFLGIDFAYLKARRDVSSKWSLGMLHESFEKLWIARGEQRRTPLDRNRKGSFESIHPSVAERIKGGAGAFGGKYASPVLAGIEIPAGQLSKREAELRWNDDEVKAADAQAKKALSVRERIINLFGGG
jgi:uncharacterized protein (DUF2235 family)